VVSIFFPLIQVCWGKGVVLRIKKGIAEWLSPENGHEKRQEYPYMNRTPLPVIVLSDIVKKARLTLYQTE